MYCADKNIIIIDLKFRKYFFICFAKYVQRKPHTYRAYAPRNQMQSISTKQSLSPIEYMARKAAKKKKTREKLHFHFISIFMLLTCRKPSVALYIGQAITPTCFRKCQNIVVRL